MPLSFKDKILWLILSKAFMKSVYITSTFEPDERVSETKC